MSAESKKKTREPLIQISKRATIPLWESYLIRFVAIVTALLLSGIILGLLTKNNPFILLKDMFVNSIFTMNKAKKYAFSETKFWNILRELSILLCVALALTPAFKMRFWNIGAEGQVLIGALACASVMFIFTGKVPNAVLVILMIVASIGAAAIWAAIPAIFKAFWGTNETLFTLMMNYVATQLISFLILHNGWGSIRGVNYTGVINLRGDYKHAGWFPSLFGQQYMLNVLIVLVITVLLYVYLRYSKHGYEISVVGESENTARYIGINVKKVIIRTMCLSGAICGVAGLILVAGTNHSLSTTTADGRGFTAIMVTWLAHFNPAYMALTAFLIVFLEKGAGELTSIYPQISAEFADVLVGITLFFIIGCEFFINYKLKFHFPKKKNEEVAK